LIHTINVGLKPRVAANEMNADARSLWISGSAIGSAVFPTIPFGMAKTKEPENKLN
jgi:hypothetical protein